MFLVLLAVVLFSTIILSTQNNLYTLSQTAYHSMISMQGYKIADRFFQEIEILNISGNKTIEQIKSHYSFADSLLRINQINYFVTSTTHWCDQYGNSTADSLHKYLRVDIRINCILGNDTLYVGSPFAPVSNIFAAIGP